jgi:predicted nucleic acid-binding protein
MCYLLDTVALVRHFAGSGKMGNKAVRLLDTAGEHEHKFVISVISLMTVMYLAEKKRTELESALRRHWIISNLRRNMPLLI